MRYRASERNISDERSRETLPFFTVFCCFILVVFVLYIRIDFVRASLIIVCPMQAPTLPFGRVCLLCATGQLKRQNS